MITSSSQNGLVVCRGLYSIQRLRQISSKSSVRDYYQILGVQKGATQRQIKAAYYELSKKYHPDVAGRDADAQAKFIEITEAYECLKDPERRRIYDSEESYGRGQSGEDPFKSRAFWEYSNRRPEGSFQSRRFTRQDYERIWQEFNRMRNERESYDARKRSEAEKLWEEFFKERQRWREFHTRSPDEASKSFRYSWRWTTSNPTANRNIVLFTRIFVAYMIVIVVVALFQMIFTPLFRPNTSPKSNRKYGLNVEQPQERTSATQFHYMKQPPVHGSGWSDVISNPNPNGREMLDSGSAHDDLTLTNTQQPVYSSPSHSV